MSRAILLYRLVCRRLMAYCGSFSYGVWAHGKGVAGPHPEMNYTEIDYW